MYKETEVGQKETLLSKTNTKYKIQSTRGTGPVRYITPKYKYKIQLKRRWPARDITLKHRYKYKYKIQEDRRPARDNTFRTMEAIALDTQRRQYLMETTLPGLVEIQKNPLTLQNLLLKR